MLNNEQFNLPGVSAPNNKEDDLNQEDKNISFVFKKIKTKLTDLKEEPRLKSFIIHFRKNQSSDFNEEELENYSKVFLAAEAKLKNISINRFKEMRLGSFVSSILDGKYSDKDYNFTKDILLEAFGKESPFPSDKVEEIVDTTVDAKDLIDDIKEAEDSKNRNIEIKGGMDKMDEWQRKREAD